LIENTFVTMDPPEHSKYRKLVTGAMLPSAVAAVALRVRETSVELIEAAIAKGKCDFVLDVSAWIPLEALAELADIPMTDRKQMFQWVNAMLGPDDPEYAASFEHALEGRRSLQSYCENLYEQRKDRLGEDIISMMIAGEIDGEPVSARRAAAFFEVLIGAGSETTRTALSHGVLELARRPEQYQAMRADPELLQTTAIGEILRWATPITYFRRGATVDCELGGQSIKAGDSVILCYASANRDAAVFDEPFVFDVRRKPNKHVSFGAGGPHNCLGANLARLEMKIFFEELCARVATIELLGDPDFLRSNIIHGIKHLPVRLHAA
jgi:cholest-4-en-3-one 26-monooxygenase